VDYAIGKVPQIDAFLRQSADEAADAAETDRRLIELMADRGAGAVVAELPPPAAASFGQGGADYVSGGLTQTLEA
jgi:hypothetical protein